MQAKKNGSLLTFFNWPKATLVPLTISGLQPVHSPALARKKVPNTKYAAVPQRDEQPPPIPMACPRISLLVERLDNLAKNLPRTIPKASDGDKLAEFGGNPEDFYNKIIDNEDLWEEEINPRSKRVLGWGTEAKMEDLIRWGRKEVEGLAAYVRYCIEEWGVNESLFEGKLWHLMSSLEEMYILSIILHPRHGDDRTHDCR